MNVSDHHFDGTNHKWLIGSIIIYMILVFNFLQPFEISIDYMQWPFHVVIPYHLVLSTYGLAAGLAIYLALKWFKPVFFNRLSNKDSKTMLLWFLMLVFWVSVVSWIHSILLYHLVSGKMYMHVPQRGFLQLVPKFMAIYSIWGLFFWVNWLLVKRAQKLTDKPITIALYSENQSDRFRINPAKLICLKTCDNYLEVYYLDEKNQLKNRMIRSSLKKAEEQLNQPQFIRSHQSFLVNKDYLKGLKKNPSGHQLEVAYIDFDVQVTKKNIKTIKSILSESP